MSATQGSSLRPYSTRRTPQHAVWGIADVRGMIGTFCDDDTLRALSQVCEALHEQFNPRVWHTLMGLGNIMKVLHDDLDVRARRGVPTEAIIPAMATCNAYRVSRFLLLAQLVQEVWVTTHSDFFIEWKRMARLQGLITLLSEQPFNDPRSGMYVGPRDRVFPYVSHITVPMGRRSRGPRIAPLVQLLAGPSLLTLTVPPVTSGAHASVGVEDAVLVFQSLTLGSWTCAPNLSRVCLFAEQSGPNVSARLNWENAFAGIAGQLTHCTIAEWSLSRRTMELLGAAPLRYLKIQGQPAVSSGDLAPLVDLVLPDGSFGQLTHLLLSSVSMGSASFLVRLPSLLQQVTRLTLEITPTVFLMPPEHDRWQALLTALANAPQLGKCLLVGNTRELEPLTELAVQWMQPLIARRLDVLRLYKLSFSNERTFAPFREAVGLGWDNLRELEMIHQDLSPEDLVAFAGLPNLTHLSGNIGRELGQRLADQPAVRFVRPLRLATQFRFRSPFFPRVSDDNRVIFYICSWFLQLFPDGLDLVVDRKYLVTGHSETERWDYDWATKTILQMKMLGIIPWDFSLETE